jgi:hypothetical protein
MRPIAEYRTHIGAVVRNKRPRRRSQLPAAYLFSSALLVIAWPPFEISWPAPATVLHPAKTTTPAISKSEKSLVILNPLEDD